MRLKRTKATIASGLLAGAIALGFGLGTAQAEPVDWTAAAETTASLDMGDGPGSETLPTGTFTGQVDEDAGTITGEVEHPSHFIEAELPILGDSELHFDLTIADIALDWDQDDDSVSGTAVLQMALTEAGPIPLAPCVISAPVAPTGTFVDDVLTFGGELGEISLDGTCGGLADAVEGAIGDIAGSFETTVGGDAPEIPEDTTTTTEAPAEAPAEDPAPSNGAAPIAQAPSYTG